METQHNVEGVIVICFFCRAQQTYSIRQVNSLIVT